MSAADSIPHYPMTRGCPFDPPAELTAMQARQPVARVRIWDESTPWLITGYREARALLADPRLSADGLAPGYPNADRGKQALRTMARNLVNTDDPEHAQRRRMLTRDFTVKSVEARRPKIQQLADELIDAMLAGPKPADLVEAIALPLPSTVICELLGVPYQEHERFERLSRAQVSQLTAPQDARDGLREMLGLIGQTVDVKASEPGDDIISRLVTEQISTGALTRADAIEICQGLLVAGHETTANMIALGTLTFLQHPDIVAELRDTDDPALVEASVEEMLRYLTVAHTGKRRVATADIDIAGCTIKAGDGVIIALETANRDPAAFQHPAVLDIHQAARHHLAFGFGIHQCLGQAIARTELSVVYPTLLRRIPTLRLAVPLEEIRFKQESVVYGVHELPVTW
jgi:cytochrome P450